MNRNDFIPRRRAILRLGALAAAVAAPGLRAQGAWPSKPVRLLVGFPPGGVADVLARAISAQLQEGLGQTVVIENRGGANGNLAAEAVAKSGNDSHVFAVVTTGVETVNPLLIRSASFDARRDLLPVAMLGRIQLFLAVRSDFPADTVKAFVDQARAQPGKLSYGSAGSGSTPHLAGELFKQGAGFFATHIPYRGAAPSLQDLLAGQIQFHFDPGIGFPHVRAGKLKFLGVASATRSAIFPNVPTIAERGYKNVEADTIFGVYAPAGTPPEVVSRMNREINRVLALPGTRERFVTVGAEPSPGTPSQFKEAARLEAAAFQPVIEARKITFD